MNFTVWGKPVPQERPLVLKQGWTVDRPKSKKAKRLVAQVAQVALQGPWRAILGPKNQKVRLRITLRFFGAHPNADLDNLYKLVTDACQGVLYANDSQIDHAKIWRLSAEKGKERTEVELCKL